MEIHPTGTYNKLEGAVQIDAPSYVFVLEGGVFFSGIEGGACFGGEVTVAVDCGRRIYLLQMTEQLEKGLLLCRCTVV